MERRDSLSKDAIQNVRLTGDGGGQMVNWRDQTGDTRERDKGTKP